MYRNLLIAALALGSASLSAQSTSFNLTLTPENNGADTRFTWSYTGVPTYTNPMQDTVRLVKGFQWYAGGLTTSTSGSSNLAFDVAPSSIIAPSTGLVMTDPATSQNGELKRLQFTNYDGFITEILLGFADIEGLMIAAGENALLSGPTTGSFLTDIDYSSFSAGSWTFDSDAYNFDPILTITGAPIPEPSTYGLILGGLALAGAAIRRRKSAK